MTWLITLIVTVLGGVSGLLLAGCVANACVSWYQITAREGASGYFIVYISLAGGIAGLIISFITAQIVVANFGPGFLKEFGGVAGVLLLIAGVAAVVCRLLAHMPPTIDGQELNLEVEFRFPTGTAATNPPTSDGEWIMQLDPLVKQNRETANGEIDTAAARLENGQWIVPTKVHLFTQRGRRSVSLRKTGSTDGFGFLLPVPARPGKDFEEWSGWFPRQQSNGQPWPADKMSCRFSVQIIPPPPPPKTQAEYEAEEAAKKEAEFGALPADAPLSAWLPYLNYDQPQTERTLQAIAKRPNLVREIEELALGDDTPSASSAMRCIAKLPGLTEQFNAPMHRVGRDIIERIRKVNAISVEQDPGYLAAGDIGIRFTSWHIAVSVLREKSGGDFTPELKTMLELSRERKDSRSMQMDVCRVASYYLHEWAGVAPLPTDPKPR